MLNHIDLDQFPVTIAQPDNSDVVNPTAATLNVPTDGTINRSFYLHNRLAGELATSWRTRANPGATCRAAAFYQSFWWCCDPNDPDKIQSSLDWGETWASLTIGLDNLGCNSIDFDAAGNAVVANNGSTTTYEWATPTWVHHLTSLIGTVNRPQVKFEPTNAVWGIFYNDTTAVTGRMRFASSANRAAWTDQTANLPAAFTVVSTITPHMGQGNGRFVVACRLGVNTIEVGSAASNALNAWTGAALTTVITATDCSDPIYSAEDATWLLAVYGTSAGNPATEIWASRDGGVTWTKVKTISASSIAIVQLANVGHLWVGICSGGTGVYSVDAGVTWKTCGTQLALATSTTVTIWAGGGGLLVLDYGISNGSRVTSVRLGNQGALPLT